MGKKSSAKTQWMLFSTYFRYSYAGGKFKRTYTEFFFRKVAYTRYDVAWFVVWMDFSNSNGWNVPPPPPPYSMRTGQHDSKSFHRTIRRLQCASANFIQTQGVPHITRFWKDRWYRATLTVATVHSVDLNNDRLMKNWKGSGSNRRGLINCVILNH
jgi:hypothetical protein